MAGPWEKYGGSQTADDGPWAKYEAAPQPPKDDPGGLKSVAAGLGSGFGRVALGAQELLGKGIQKAGEVVTPDEAGVSSLVTGKKKRGLVQSAGDWLVNDAQQGRSNLASEMAPYKEAHPILAGGGEVAGEVIGTLPVGGILGKVIGKAAPLAGRAAPVVDKLASSAQSGGLRLGGAPATTLAGKAGNAGLRALGGAATGGASAGLIDPESAGAGALLGGVLPGGVAAAGAAGRGIRNSLSVSPEVAGLAGRAKALGIDIPADRITNSKPLNALAATLEYVPFSGRAATGERMTKQLNTALSKTFGQNSDNVTQALRKAQNDLGQKFDSVLQNNSVRLDHQFATDLVDAGQMASRELGSDGAKIINNQIDEILQKAATGDIDGQAAYNIKKTLDRIGRRNSPEAHYALDLKGHLMDALDRSLGPAQASEFAGVRRQYGNMLSLEKLAQNGAEGDISIARLANMKGIRSKDLQELADISAQFLKPRESQHGALQRLVIGGAAGGLAGLPTLAGGAVAGRAANAALNSNGLRNALLKSSGSTPRITNGDSSALAQLLARSAPATVTPSDRR